MLRLRSGIKSLLCVKSGVHTSGMFREDIKALGKLRHFHTAIMYCLILALLHIVYMKYCFYLSLFYDVLNDTLPSMLVSPSVSLF